ncbi:MAG: hypothetical protein QOD49_608 [Actinomycetota bacterium]|nr:hypothetical protein [Actinomycetota bacterium]
MRHLLIGSVATAVLMGGLPGAQAAAANPTVTIDGSVSTVTTYSLSQLRSMSTTFNVAEPGPLGSQPATEVGVPLESLVTPTVSYPPLTNSKSKSLRVTVTVRGEGGRAATFSLGELDPNVGNHLALVSLERNGIAYPKGPELVVPGDVNRFRWVTDVQELTIGVTPAEHVGPPQSGAVTVQEGRRRAVLSPTLLSLLPAVTATVSFIGPGGTQTHTESGPPLALVLLVAGDFPGDFPGRNAWVTAVGADDYAATVTPDEAFVGGRTLILSLNEDHVALTQPRLIAGGDVKGGRYVSGVDNLAVGEGPAS